MIKKVMDMLSTLSISHSFSRSPKLFGPLDIREITLLGRLMKVATNRHDQVLSAMLRGDRSLCPHFQAELAWLKDQIRPGDKIIDAGANIGSVAIALALKQSDAHIMSFEPDPMNYGLLQINLLLNSCDNVFAFNLALGDSAGLIHLFRSPYNFGDHRTSKPKGLDLHEPEFNELPYRVSQVSGSEFIKQVFTGWRINLVKIDTQGADFTILNDLMSLLASDAKVGIEFSPYHLDTHGTSFEQVAAVLKQFKEISRIVPNNQTLYELLPINIDELRNFFDAQKGRYRTHFDLALFR